MKKHDERRAEVDKEAPEPEAHEQASGQDPRPGDVEQDALADAQRERDDYLARWQRAQADFQNLRRRTLADIDAAVRRSQQSLLEGILLSIDQLELALAAPRASSAAAKEAASEFEGFVRGVEMTRAELLRTLAQAGVQPLALEPGQRFDPARHQAVASVPAPGKEPGTVVEIVRRGYTWGDVVLRPAHVVVAASAPATGPEDR